MAARPSEKSWVPLTYKTLKTLDCFRFHKKNFSPTKMTQKPLSTRTTKREEFSYIFMVLKELGKMLLESLTKRSRPASIETNQKTTS